jgi:hypothetical protein
MFRDSRPPEYRRAGSEDPPIGKQENTTVGRTPLVSGIAQNGRQHWRSARGDYEREQQASHERAPCSPTRSPAYAPPRTSRSPGRTAPAPASSPTLPSAAGVDVAQKLARHARLDQTGEYLVLDQQGLPNAPCGSHRRQDSQARRGPESDRVDQNATATGPMAAARRPSTGGPTTCSLARGNSAAQSPP